MAMQKHKYRQFTTRDGSKACAECHGNEHAEQHQQEPLIHSETSYCGDLNCGQCNTRWEAVKAQVSANEVFTQDYDRGDGVFVDAVQSHVCRFESPIDHGSEFCHCGAQRQTQ